MLWASLGLTRQGLPEQLPRGQLGDGDASGWTRCGGTWQVENPFYGEYSGQDGGTQLSLWSQSMTSGRVGAAVIAQAGLELQYNGYLVFDYLDGSNYKYAGMDGTGQRWVIREVVSGTDTLRAGVAGTIVKGTLYDVEVQVSGNLATLKVGGVVKTSYAFDGIQGGQVGLRIAQAHTHFKEVYLRAFSQVTKYYTFGGRPIAMRRDHILFFLAGDHLGTVSVVLDAAGNVVDESRHYPYGTERWALDGTFPTDYRFTGQLLDSSLGLYQMGARWYDPMLGRWLSADTVVPAPANPHSLNGYSYVLGNPLVYRDPSGHAESGGQEGGVAPPPPLPDWLIELLSSPDFLKWLGGQIDNWLWDNVPSVIGTQFGVGCSFGVVVEGEFYPIDLAGVFNWRSGEFSILASPGLNAYFGTPRFMSGSLYAGVVMVEGASENRYLQGWGQYKGGTAAVEALGGVGVSITAGRAITSADTNQDAQVDLRDDYVDFVDPGSGRRIVTTQLNAVGSVNAIPNGLDIGYLTGYNYTAVTTIRLPWWPFR